MEPRLMRMLDNIADAFFFLDLNFDFIYLNRQAQGIFQKDRALLIGKCIWTEFPLLISTPLYREFREALKSKESKILKYNSTPSNRWFEVRIYPDDDGLMVYFFDITDQKKSETQLYENTERFRAIFENSAIGIGVVDLDGKPVECNHALLDMLGYTMDEVSKTSFVDLTHPDDVDKDLTLFHDLLLGKRSSYQIEKRYIRKNHQVIWARLTVSPIFNVQGEIQFIMSMTENITDMKIAEQKQRELTKELQRLSALDGLTELNNRRAFDEFFNQEWHRCLKDGLPLSLILLDIDGFKKYNDTYGHHEGDTCLKTIATTLKEALHEPNHFICRYGGEEFAVILSDTNQETAEMIAESLRVYVESLQIYHLYSHSGKYVTASLGVSTIIPSIFSNPQQLLKNADKALYEAKDYGRNQVRVFSA
ncbi:diguanylate cyclase (GGDEF)-like protein/PAS domain S-box-containing protein [Anaerosolibacter carboniphilus]|uniref:Diguanylate cyclase (GGDEF)-like protein/PAS domain S-box-containing protein n=1 Tax=Anaerosolibacter carboniphilus TaxID=1417629 RepID=A0A841KZ44_9FIRM|nr:sensor domain-containing diguanylate cyclase [Anaerosolibacter carboniphilus]MBB6218894.1 diguanylate cyclase (GGDEF)-like protein/PAS domain S-box-containing protein [Anaerosolibacter carboniphilus]